MYIHKKRSTAEIIKKAFYITLVSIFCVVGLSRIQADATKRMSIKEKRGGNLKPTDFELRSLPKYCTAKFNMSKNSKTKSASDKAIQRKYGEDFRHIHHLCFALTAINRLKKGMGDRNFLLGTADGQLNYMLRHVSKNSILLPDIYSLKGYVLTEMGRISEAQEYYSKLIFLKKKARRR